MNRAAQLCLLLLPAALLACTAAKKRSMREEIALPPPSIEAVLSCIDAPELLARVRVLSSDEFEGRAPGTPAEEKTVAYIAGELERVGVLPGAPGGSYEQKVPLIGLTSATTVRVEAGGAPLELAIPTDLVAGSRRFVDKIAVQSSPIVFAGYGVQSPEVAWDDFAGLDVAGKTLLVLVNDPAVLANPDDPEDPTLDPAWFKGRAMTYFGRWTYKYEVASELGAAAILIVHETGPAGYGWEVVQGSFGREAFEIEREDGNMGRVPIEGWITHEAAGRLLAACGQDLDALKEEARKPGFRPVALDARASFDVENTMRKVASRNVIGRVEGSDPAVRDQVVLFTAHWDHLGRDPSLKGDTIYNGALDNATGTAGVLELAEAFARMHPAPRRSLLFLFTTAEEKGLLGSRWYATHPVVPLERTLAVINLDGLNPWGRTRDIGVTGYGMTTLDDLVIAAAVLQGRTVMPDAEPEKGYYYRSDHFELAKLGVPALDLDAGLDYVGRPEAFGREKRADYLAERYHRPQDEIDSDWDLSGAVLDLYLAFRVAFTIAESDTWPRWKPGAEFRAVREKSLATSESGASSGALP